MDASVLDANVLGLLLPIIATAAIALYRTAHPPVLNPTKADKTEAGEGEEKTPMENLQNKESGGEQAAAEADQAEADQAEADQAEARRAEEIAKLARSAGTAEEANLPEVPAKDLEIGKNYYIEMVGRYKNKFRQSGKALGIAFKKTITFKDIEEQLGPEKFYKFDCGIGLDCFEPNDIFVEFERVDSVNDEGRECGICRYEFYPATPNKWNTYTDEEKTVSRGGYKFFEEKKIQIVKKALRIQALRQALRNDDTYQHLPPDIIPEITKYAGGKKRKSKRKKSKKVKSKKLKRKKKNKTEKNKTKKK